MSVTFILQLPSEGSTFKLVIQLVNQLVVFHIILHFVSNYEMSLLCL